MTAEKRKKMSWNRKAKEMRIIFYRVVVFYTQVFYQKKLTYQTLYVESVFFSG